MGDESMVSGMSGTDAGGGPPGAAGPIVGAEGVMKKLSNYWFIVGSIPLVLFLLVCLPTVFYVKSISEFKNAYYCRSKACDALADATRGAREAKPCDDYFGSVCSAASKFTLKDINERDKKFLTAAQAQWGDTPHPKGPLLSYATSCNPSGEPYAAVEQPSFDFLGITGPAEIGDFISKADSIPKMCEKAHAKGIDCLFHLEWVQSGTKKVFADAPRPTIGEELPDQPTPYYDLAISQADMGIMEPTYYLIQLGGMKYTEVVEAFFKPIADDVADDVKLRFPKLQEIYEFMEYCKDLDFTAAPVVTPQPEFGMVPADKKDKQQLVLSFVVDKMVTGYTRFLVRCPNYVKLLTLAINTCEADDKCQMTLPDLTLYVVIDLLMKYNAHTLFTGSKLDEAIKQLWCTRFIDWLSPTVFNVVAEKYLRETYWPFALKNVKDPKAPLAPNAIGYEYMTKLLDSFQHSYALSEASSEKSRAGLYVKILQMEFFAFYKNTTDKVDEAYLDIIEKNANLGDFNSFAPLWAAREQFFKAYWAIPQLAPMYLIARHPLMFSDDEGSYDYGTNTMYVPFGTFRPHFFRDSTVYMGNYATFGYYGSMNLLKLLDHAGGYTKAGYQHPVLWTGTYAMGKMAWQYRCLNEAKVNNTDARLVAKGSRPLSPGFRFFRREALIRAYPRPEYRLDTDAKADMEQIYLTTVMRSYCRYPKMKESVNKMFLNDMYYQKAYCSETGGKMKRDADKLCYIWHSTRREY